MQHIFASPSDKKDGFILVHPHPLVIYLPEATKGGTKGTTMNGELFPTPEAWLDGVNRKLLLLGITDVQCLSVPPDKTKKEAARFHFYFSNEFERYQFEAAVLPNIPGLFKRTMTATTSANSLDQQNNIQKFRSANELDMSIYRTSPTSLTLTTVNSHDDLIIAMHLAKRSFDIAAANTASANNKIPQLLTYSKKAEIDAPKNAP